ncbi:hypothetical protein KY289_031031 [Solanum tuberosum]|nr:hypothetical protein KY284_030700 [Solanum tuberosum]KAH0653353.1 hypothetical protein KY289_031031 [Solanum tuberosum]
MSLQKDIMFLSCCLSDADNISDEQKARICKKFAEADKCLVDEADEYLELLNVASSTMQALSNMPQGMAF